jgi:hypothetical protein
MKTTLILILSITLLFACNKEKELFIPQYQEIPGI